KLEVLVVSGDVRDIGMAGRSTGPLPDFSVESYAEVIERLVAAGVRTIVVSWATEAHMGEVDFAPLERALEGVPKDTEVVFIAASETQSGLPASIVARARVLSDTPCWYPDRIQTLCSYNPTWKFWIAQHLVDKW